MGVESFGYFQEKESDIKLSRNRVRQEKYGHEHHESDVFHEETIKRSSTSVVKLLSSIPFNF